MSTVSEPIISVNCSGRYLKYMPNQLPQFTRILHLENNEIKSLSPLKNNPHYKYIWDLYMDNNEVSSIIVLEGSYWLSHFRTLSLRGNKLRKVSLLYERYEQCYFSCLSNGPFPFSSASSQCIFIEMQYIILLFFFYSTLWWNMWIKKFLSNKTVL